MVILTNYNKETIIFLKIKKPAVEVSSPATLTLASTANNANSQLTSFSTLLFKIFLGHIFANTQDVGIYKKNLIIKNNI